MCVCLICVSVLCQMKFKVVKWLPFAVSENTPFNSLVCEYVQKNIWKKRWGMKMEGHRTASPTLTMEANPSMEDMEAEGLIIMTQHGTMITAWVILWDITAKRNGKVILTIIMIIMMTTCSMMNSTQMTEWNNSKGESQGMLTQLILIFGKSQGERDDE